MVKVISKRLKHPYYGQVKELIDCVFNSFASNVPSGVTIGTRYEVLELSTCRNSFGEVGILSISFIVHVLALSQ